MGFLQRIFGAIGGIVWIVLFLAGPAGAQSAVPAAEQAVGPAAGAVAGGRVAVIRVGNLANKGELARFERRVREGCGRDAAIAVERRASDAPAGKMIGQYPARGTRVGCDAARAILYVSDGPQAAALYVPALVTPRQRDGFERQASAVCRARVRIDERREASDLFRGAFLSQRPQQGQLYRCGAAVVVAVSAGDGGRQAEPGPRPAAAAERRAVRPERVWDGVVVGGPAPKVEPGRQDPAQGRVQPKDRAQLPPAAAGPETARDATDVPVAERVLPQMGPAVAPEAAAAGPAVPVGPAAGAGVLQPAPAPAEPLWPWLAIAGVLVLGLGWLLRREADPLPTVPGRKPGPLLVGAPVPPGTAPGTAPLGLVQGRPLATCSMAPAPAAAPATTGGTPGEVHVLPPKPVLGDLLGSLVDVADLVAATSLGDASAAALGGQGGRISGGETLAALRRDIEQGLARALLFELAPLIAEGWGSAKALPHRSGAASAAGDILLAPHGLCITLYPDLTLRAGGIPLFRLDLSIELRMGLAAAAAVVRGRSLEALRPGRMQVAATLHWCGRRHAVRLPHPHVDAPGPIALRPARYVPGLPMPGLAEGQTALS